MNNIQQTQFYQTKIHTETSYQVNYSKSSQNNLEIKDQINKIIENEIEKEKVLNANEVPNQESKDKKKLTKEEQRNYDFDKMIEEKKKKQKQENEAKNARKDLQLIPSSGNKVDLTTVNSNYKGVFSNIKEDDDDDEEEISQIENYRQKVYRREDSQKGFLLKILYIVIFFIIDILVNCTIMYPSAILLGLFGLVNQIYYIFKYRSKENLSPMTRIFFFLIIITGSVATIYLQFMCFYYLRKDTIEKFWFLDALIYFMSTLLVCSYVKAVHSKIDSFSEIFKLENFYGNKVINTLFMSSSGEDEAFVFDCVTEQNDQYIIDEYKRVMKEYSAQSIAQRFSNFQIKGDPTLFTNKGVEIVIGTTFSLTPSYGQYITLFSLITLKTLLSLTYIYLHKVDFNLELAVSIIATTLFYMNMTWSLSKVLSSQDLRRKIMMLKLVNSMIDYQEADNQQEQSLDKIDITCTVSLETWDNTRQFIYDFYSSKLSKLEFAYVCLFANYVFVTFLSVIAYGELYTIIPKESLYLQPLMVIQNSIDFIFLNALFLWRIYNGQKLNDTFENTQNNIDHLLGIEEDLSQMFDFYFLPERQLTLERKEQRYYQQEQQYNQQDNKSDNNISNNNNNTTNNVWTTNRILQEDIASNNMDLSQDVIQQQYHV